MQQSSVHTLHKGRQHFRIGEVVWAGARGKSWERDRVSRREMTSKEDMLQGGGNQVGGVGVRWRCDDRGEMWPRYVMNKEEDEGGHVEEEEVEIQSREAMDEGCMGQNRSYNRQWRGRCANGMSVEVKVSTCGGKIWGWAKGANIYSYEMWWPRKR